MAQWEPHRIQLLFERAVVDIDFVGNQTLRLDSLSGIGGAALTDLNECPRDTGSLVFHNYSGGGSAAISGGQYQGCGMQLGANFPQNSPGFNGGSLEFSGVTFTFADIAAVNNGGTASGARLDVGGTNGSIGMLVAGGVPEPPTWALFIAGFGAVGEAMRRHRKSEMRERLATS